MPHAATEQAVYKQIAIDIASKVVNGRYRPGQKIHGRSTLASQYNVSPETVRRAVFLLNQVGVLQVRQGAGITILSVENAEEFLSKSNERQSLDTIKNHIYLNPLTPFELTIEEGCPLVGQTIASVHFWNNTGATIIAIRRKGSTILSPGPHAQFFAGDHILIVGDEAAYQKTRQLLDERVQ